MKEIDFKVENIGTIDFLVDISTKEIYPPLENLEVTPIKEQQVFTHENSYGYDEVIVNGINLQDKIVKPSDETQIIVADEGFSGLNQVEVEPQETKPYKPRYISFQNSQETELDQEISLLDTSLMTRFYETFYSCRRLIRLDLSNFNTNNITDMNSAFYGCTNLTSLNLSNFNTEKVTDMRSMFYGCSALTTLDLSSFHTPQLENINATFQNCRALTYLDIRNFDFAKIKYKSNTFSNVPENCEIIVKDETAKTFITTDFPTLTNVKTVAEL